MFRIVIREHAGTRLEKLIQNILNTFKLKGYSFLIDLMRIGASGPKYRTFLFTFSLYI